MAKLNGNDSDFDSIENAYSKANNVASAASGDISSLATVVVDAVGGNNIATNTIKQANNTYQKSLGKIVTVASAFAGDPFAQIRLAAQVITWLSNSKPSITLKKGGPIPPTKVNKTNSENKEYKNNKPKSQELLKKPKQEVVSKKPSIANDYKQQDIPTSEVQENNKLNRYDESRSDSTENSQTQEQDLIPQALEQDTYEFREPKIRYEYEEDAPFSMKSKDHQVDFKLSELATAEDFPINLENASYEELKALLIQIDAELTSEAKQAKYNEVIEWSNQNYQDVKDQFKIFYDELYSDNFDTEDCYFSTKRDAIDGIKTERTSIFDDIDSLKSENKSTFELIESLKESKSSAYYAKDYDSISTFSSQITEEYDNLKTRKSEISALYEYINTEFKPVIEELYAEVNAAKAEIKAEYESQKQAKFDEINWLVKQQQQFNADRINTLYKVKNTILQQVVKSKLCNWNYCFENKGKAIKAFDLKVSDLLFQEKMGFEERTSCDCCIAYKKKVEKLGLDNKLTFTCKGSEVKNSVGAIISTAPCPHGSIYTYESRILIGIPKLKGNEPILKLDGTDTPYQCQACLASSNRGNLEIPFIDCPTDIQQGIDRFIRENTTTNDELVIANHRKLYAILYQMGLGGIGINLQTNANNPNYKENGQTPSSKETKFLHLLKHSCNLGENFHSGHWGSWVNDGSYDQPQMRTILGLSQFNGVTNRLSSFPRQRLGFVLDVRFPNAFDTATQEAIDYLDCQLSAIQPIVSVSNKMKLVFPISTTRNQVITTQANLNVIIEGDILTSCYYLNSNPNAHQNLVKQYFGLPSEPRYTNWLANAKLIYADNEDQMKLLNQTADGFYPNIGVCYIKPQVAKWDY